MKRDFIAAAALGVAVAFLFSGRCYACTNLIVTPGASVDGSMFCSYSADDYGMFGSLCHYAGGAHAVGTMRDVVDWETGAFRGQIHEAEVTYNVIGNINEHQVTIAETTYGGREEMVDSTGLLDYGSLIYIALQRSRTSREAIAVMTSLVEKYGYCSEGETFSVCDPKEAWIMEMMGRGAGSKGVVWVAVRIPDGAICAHANQSRIGRVRDYGDDVMMSDGLVDFAREKGWFAGKDKDFSWKDAFARPDFEGRRMCDARVWSFFRRFTDVSRYDSWALGHDESAEDLPLWVVPERKVELHDVMMAMSDHYEGTELSLVDSTTLAGGIWEMPYRPTPLTFEWGGRTYYNERAISTQQTAFTFVSQMRSSMSNCVGGVLWFGNDDANMIAYVPIYCCSTRRPVCFDTPGVDELTFSFKNAYWLCNWVSNMVYPRYSALFPDLEAVRDSLEGSFVKSQGEVEMTALGMDKEAAISYLEEYSIGAAGRMMERWMDLAMLLIVKHNDMIVKPQNEDGSFVRTEEGLGARVRRVGYSDGVKRVLVESGGVKEEK